MTRPVPTQQITTRNAILGGRKPLICVPFVGKNPDEIRLETEKLAQITPDIIELRVDAWECIEEVESATRLLSEVRAMIATLPIILTCRGDWEGGIQKVSEKAKDALYSFAIEKRLVEFVDKELYYGYERLKELKKHAASNDVKLIVSWHNFESTPSVAAIYGQLQLEVSCGADIAKCALMPRREEDVLSLLESTLRFRRDFPAVPLITMSMGALGQVSRLCGGQFGSDLTFAVGNAASAPGQIPFEEVRRAFELLYNL